MPAAARVDDKILHSSAMKGLLLGAAAGLLIGAAVVATGGAAAVAIAAGAATGASLGGMAGKFVGSLITSEEGEILQGSPNVYVNGKPAAFCTSPVKCKKDGGPQAVTQGSATVAVNRLPFARTDDMGSCGFKVGQGSPNVTVGGDPVACGPVGSEVPWQADAALMVLGLAGGGVALAVRGLTGAQIAARLGGAMLGGTAGSMGGSYIGGEVFGQNSTGQNVMTFLGGFGGGAAGYRGGARLDAYPRANPFNYRAYPEPNTLGSNLANVRVRYVGPSNTVTALSGGRSTVTTHAGQQIRLRHGTGGRLESAVTRIEPQHLRTGTATNAASRTHARTLGRPNDDAGHGVGSLLGGPGNVRAGNIFPQNLSVNRGAFRAFESQVARQVRNGDHVVVRVVPRYRGTDTRPYEVLYQVRVNGQTQPPTVFPNP